MLHRTRVLLTISIGTFMSTLDSSIVNNALPTLMRHFGSTLTGVKWVLIVYQLTITCLLLPIGKLSDRLGRKKFFLLGMQIFTLGSLLCGISNSVLMLALARALQGIGAAMLMANGPAIITSQIESSERGSALGKLAISVGAGLALGPPLGGLLLSYTGWRSIFLINIPIGILGHMLAKKWLYVDEPTPIRAHFDWKGAILQTAILISFLLFLDFPHRSLVHINYFSSAKIIPLVSLFIFTAAFIWNEKKVSDPILNFSLLKNPYFLHGNLAAFFLFIAYNALFIILPFYLQEALFMNPKQSGMLLTATPLMLLLVSPISGRLSDLFGSRGLTLLGSSLLAAMLLFLSFLFYLDRTPSIFSILVSVSVAGAALGLFQPPNNNSIMSNVPATKLGTASALLATMRNLGVSTGIGMGSMLFSWKEQETQSFPSAMSFTLMISALGALLAAWISGRKKDYGVEEKGN